MPDATPARVQGVDHVQLPVPVGALPRARAFYQDLLGLQEVRDPLLDRPGSLHFSLGWQRLTLREGAYTGVAPQAHVGLQARALAALADALEAAGHRVQRATAPGGEARLRVDDPFGNRLEITEPPPSSLPISGGPRVTAIHLAI